MVVVVIIAILAAIAYPSYIDQMRKSKRGAAKSALLDLSNRQEQYFFTNKAYANAVNMLPGYTAATDPLLFDKNSAYTTVNADAVYAVSVATIDDNPTSCGGAPCFQLQAVPQNDQQNDVCGTFTLTSSNKRDVSNAAGTPASACW